MPSDAEKPLFRSQFPTDNAYFTALSDRGITPTDPACDPSLKDAYFDWLMRLANNPVIDTSDLSSVADSQLPESLSGVPKDLINAKWETYGDQYLQEQQQHTAAAYRTPGARLNNSSTFFTHHLRDSPCRLPTVQYNTPTALRLRPSPDPPPALSLSDSTKRQIEELNRALEADTRLFQQQKITHETYAQQAAQESHNMSLTAARLLEQSIKLAKLKGDADMDYEQQHQQQQQQQSPVTPPRNTNIGGYPKSSTWGSGYDETGSPLSFRHSFARSFAAGLQASAQTEANLAHRPNGQKYRRRGKGKGLQAAASVQGETIGKQGQGQGDEHEEGEIL